MIQLGDKVRDPVTGIVGIAIARTEWMHGCIRYVVQPQETKDGKPVESISVDEPQLVVVEAGVVPNNPFWREPPTIEPLAIEPRRVAGPRPDVTPLPHVTR